MELSQYFKSILQQDPEPVVICDLSHTILYMNPAACREYRRFGGEALLGKDLLACHNSHSQAAIKNVLAYFAENSAHNRIHTFFSEKENKDVYMVALRDEAGALIGYYEKHESRQRDDTPFYSGIEG